MAGGGKAELATRATELKKAWLLLTACHPPRGLDPALLSVPVFSDWPRRAVAEQVEALRTDVADALSVVATVRRANVGRTTRWLASRYDEWDPSIPFILSTALEFEATVGSLAPVRRNMEVPPYAQLLLQGWNGGLAIRHPEYHLARDVAALNNLYLDALHAEARATHTEVSQTLARATIVACFSLLEGFLLGVAKARILEMAPGEVTPKALTETRKPLAERLVEVPAALRPDKVLTRDMPWLMQLLGDSKVRRDAFVHCEPGPPSRPRHQAKDAVFHTESSELLVLATVNATVEAIRELWRYVHDREGPKWLPRHEGKRFVLPHSSLRIVGDAARPPAPTN